MEPNLNHNESAAFLELKKHFHYTKIDTIYKGSNYIKYGNFTAIADGRFVIKFFHLKFSFFADILSKASVVQNNIMSADLGLVVPHLHHCFELSEGRFLIWEFLPGKLLADVLSELPENIIFEIPRRLVRAVKALENLGKDPELRNRVGEHYELRDIYENLFFAKSSERILTHGDMNIGNISIHEDKLYLFDWDNLSYQSQNLVFANLTLLWLMSSKFNNNTRLFKLALESMHAAITVHYEIRIEDLIKYTLILAQKKISISMNGAHVQSWLQIEKNLNLVALKNE